MAKQIAIIGNGPSRNLFEEPFNGDVCICNIPQIKVKYDYIAIVDRKAMNYIQDNKIKYEKPILTTPVEYKKSREWGWTTPVEGVFEEKLMNCAATAAYYFAQEYDTIYLYGCNALWSEYTKSYQDEIIPRPTRGKKLHLQWRDYWQRVWQTDKQFVIVHDPEAKPEDYGTNVLWMTRLKTK